MLFCSYPFLYFLVIVFLVYWAIPNHRCRVWWLLGASFFFYASWNAWLATLIFFTAVVDYLVALGMEAASSPARRKGLLIVSLVMNLGVLVYFKYANFFLHSLETMLDTFGASASFPLLRTILPIGISFYTFEAINYTVDVYRGKVKAERNLDHFLLFILFFPHLVAGPIVRAADFLPQIRRRKHFSWIRMNAGIQLLLLGLFKKLAIADRLAILADPIFKNPDQYGTYATWVAVLAYALQIYCDFSGYSDMALGTAHLLGYHLALNFNMPYLARNISEFWRRWHISLSTWLRDYLFIPLGGSRGGRWLTYRNLLITMTLGGLWHGASWTFVVWGLIHGLLLIGHKAFQEATRFLPLVGTFFKTRPGQWLGIGLTFFTVILAWVPFRSTTFSGATTIIGNLFVFLPRQKDLAMHTNNLWYFLALVAITHVVVEAGWWRKFFQALPAPAMGIAYGFFLTLTMVLTPDIGKAFIYFQF